MSYDIIYNKQFVKLPDNNYVPMILSGSNNVISYENSNRGRRARDWWCHTYVLKNSENEYFGTDTLILKNVQESIDECVTRNANVKKQWDDHIYTEQEVKDRFGYFSSLSIGSLNTGKATATMYYNIYKNGIKKALTIEQLDALGINLEFHVYEWSGHKYSIPFPEWHRKTIKTTEEFLKICKQIAKYKKSCIVTDEKGKDLGSPSVFLDYDGSTDWIVTKLRRFRKKEKKQPIDYKSEQVDFYFTLKNDSGYFYKYTRSGYKYSWSHPMRQFRTEKEALAFKQALVRKRRYNAETWEVKQINEKFTFRTPIYA